MLSSLVAFLLIVLFFFHIFTFVDLKTFLILSTRMLQALTEIGNLVNKVSNCDMDDNKETEKNLPRILVADKLSESLTKKLSSIATLIIDPSLKGETLTKAIATFQPKIIIVRSTKVTKADITESKELSLIIRAGAGVNTIDINEASNYGIFVANCPGKNAIAVAELCIGHLINLDRRIVDNVIQLRDNGNWNKKNLSKNALGLYGRTLSVIGCTGMIGSEVVKRAKGFGMKIKGWSRSLTQQYCDEHNIIFCSSIEECVTNSDALTVHIPFTNKTKYIINKKILNLLNDNAYIINTSRGGIICEKDLIELIPIKHFRVALDVYEDEPNVNKDIYSNNNIYGTHHIGASTDQASEAIVNECVKIVLNYLKTGEVYNCVNLEKSRPAKYSLSVRHKNVVGVLAFLLNEVRSEGINVLQMDNIIFKDSKAACATLELDKAVSNNALQKIINSDLIYGVDQNLL